MVCATCKKVFRAEPGDSRPRSFCSERCRFADLGKWLSGDYRIPDLAEDGEDDGHPRDEVASAAGETSRPRGD